MQRKTKIIFAIVFIIEILAIFLITFGILYFDNQNKELSTKKDELASIITNSKKDYDEYLQDYEFYVNIDSKLEALYDEYYTNIAKLEEKIEAGESDRKIAYLTFDDGPYKLTDKVLDILKENNIKATFFCIGKTEVDDKYQRIVNEGHVLANHTYSHAITKGLYNSVESFISQTTK